MTTPINDDLLDAIRRIRVNKRHGRHSPHKPLLLLLSIGRHLDKCDRLAKFSDIEADLNRLILRFGLPDSRESAHLPFWRLRNDGLWEIDRPELVRTSYGSPSISDLREHGIRGGLSEDFVNELDTDSDFEWRVAQSLLNEYFPPSLHDDILREVGLGPASPPGTKIETRSTQLARDRSFRHTVLDAYKNQCALCKFDIQVDGQPIGLEAAHIKWHSAGGPACVDNGMALCVLHHKLFDAGLFTVSSDLTVLVGESAVGNSVEHSLNKYNGTRLSVTPDHSNQRPAPKYLDWHRQAVFKAKTPK